MSVGVGFVEAIVIDVADFRRAEAFWSALVGCEFGPSFEPTFRRAKLSSGIALVLQQRPDLKGVDTRNRVHIDVEVEDIEAALARVESMGGALVERVGNQNHIVCADPDGNEFCLTPP